MELLTQKIQELSEIQQFQVLEIVESILAENTVKKSHKNLDSKKQSLAGTLVFYEDMLKSASED